MHTMNDANDIICYLGPDADEDWAIDTYVYKHGAAVNGVMITADELRAARAAVAEGKILASTPVVVAVAFVRMEAMCVTD